VYKRGFPIGGKVRCYSCGTSGLRAADPVEFPVCERRCAIEIVTRRISPATEFLVIILACYWWAIAASVVAMVSLWMRIPVPAELDDGRALILLCVEFIGLAVATGIGYLRGWSVWSFGLRPTWKGTRIGLLLAAASGVLVGTVALTVNWFLPGTVKIQVIHGSLSLPMVLLLSAINPVFEEAIGVGYFIHVLRRFGMWPAVLATALFRAAIHAYQGFNAVMIILPLGVMFAIVYWKSHRLWPLVLVHVIFSLIALLPLARLPSSQPTPTPVLHNAGGTK
jgi:membrane protease YdiL (CAAX protease family)